MGGIWDTEGASAPAGGADEARQGPDSQVVPLPGPLPPPVPVEADPPAVLGPAPSLFDPPPASPADDEPEVDVELPLPEADAAADALQGVDRELRARQWESEARARGEGAAAAVCWREAGLLHEQLDDVPRAVSCYQAALEACPDHLPSLRAAAQLFSAVGNWTQVASLLEAELACLPPGAERTAAAMELASLEVRRLDRPEGAVRDLGLAPEAPGRLSLDIWAGLRAARANDLAGLAERWEAASAQLEDPDLGLAFLCGAAGIWADRLDDPERAVGLYEAARRLDPTHPLPPEALERLYEAAGDPARLVALLVASADVASTPKAAGAALVRAARVAREHEGDPAKALALLDAARRHTPDDPALLQDLAAGYEEAGRDADLVDVLTDLAERTRDPRGAAELYHRLGALLDLRLDRPEDAAQAYRRVLERVPGSPETLASLGRLFSRTGQLDELVWTFEQEVAHLSDPRQRAARIFRMGEIRQGQGQEAEAEALFREALTLDPGYPPAVQALVSILLEARRWDDLAGLYLSEADHPDLDDRQRIDLLEKAAALQEEHLEDSDAALATLGRVLRIDPEHLPALRRMQLLYERAGRWADLAGALEREADLIGDQRQAVALLHRVCEIREDRLGSRDEAIGAWQRLLAMQPSYLPALRALGRLYQQKGRWTDLVAMYRAELEVVSDPDQRVGLLLRTGELLSTRLLDEQAAIDTYETLLVERPDLPAAFRALRALHERRGDAEALLSVLGREAERTREPTERARLHCRAAEVQERQGARDRAVASYRRALEDVPGHAQALAGLARLYGAAGAWRELATVYEQSLSAAPAAGRALVWRRLAHLYLDRLGEPGRALNALEKVLDDQPDDALALTLLARVHSQSGDGAAARAAGIRLTGRASSADVAADLLAGHLLAGEAPETDPAWERVLALAPDHPLATRHVLSHVRRTGTPDTLLPILERRLESEVSQDERLALLVEVAALALRAGAPQDAEARLREALALAPDHLPALDALRRLLAHQGRWAEVRDLAAAQAEATRDPDQALTLLREVASLSESPLEDTDGATAAWEAILSRRPGDPEAWARLEALLADRPEALAERAAWRARHLGDGLTAADAWRSLAELRRERLGDPAAALEAVEQALSLSPQAPETLELAGDLAWELGDRARATDHYQALLEFDDHPRHETRFRLATYFHEDVGDAQRAIAYLQDVLQADPDRPDALDRLARLQAEGRDWSAAADTLLRLVDTDPPQNRRVEILVRLAAIQAGRLGETEAAIAALEEVRRLQPDHLAAAERLGALYEATQAWERVVTTYRDVIRLLPESAGHRSAPIHARVATLLADYLDDAEGAAEAWREAIAARPDDLSARLALARLCSHDEAHQAEAIAQHREILVREPRRLDSHHALYRLFRSRKALDAAWVQAGLLVALGGADHEVAGFYEEGLRRLPTRPSRALSPEDRARRLLHPEARGPLAGVLAAMGNQVERIHPQDLDGLGVGRADRILPKHDSPLLKLAEALLEVLGGGDLALYRTERAGLLVEVWPGSPAAIVVGGDALRRHGPMGQRFLLGQALEAVHAGTGLAARLDALALAALIQAAVEAVSGPPLRLSPPDPDLTRLCARVLGRRARRTLAEAAAALGGAPTPDVARFREGARLTQDRAGALLCGSPVAALEVLEGQGEAASADALIAFMVSEDFGHLRAAVGLTVG